MTAPRRPHPLMSALAAGVPLTLLLDLAGPDGPDSARILRREVADTSWVTGLRAAARRAAVTTGRDHGRRAAR